MDAGVATLRSAIIFCVSVNDLKRAGGRAPSVSKSCVVKCQSMSGVGMSSVRRSALPTVCFKVLSLSASSASAAPAMLSSAFRIIPRRYGHRIATSVRSWVCPEASRRRPTALDENVSGTRNKERDIQAVCQAGTFEHVSGEDIADGVVAMSDAKTFLRDSCVISKRVHDGIAMGAAGIPRSATNYRPSGTVYFR